MNKAYTYSFSNIYIYSPVLQKSDHIVSRDGQTLLTCVKTNNRCAVSSKFSVFTEESRYRNVTIIISTIIRNQSIRFKYKSYFHSPICYFHFFLFMKNKADVLSDSVYIYNAGWPPSKLPRLPLRQYFNYPRTSWTARSSDRSRLPEDSSGPITGLSLKVYEP